MTTFPVRLGKGNIKHDIRYTAFLHLLRIIALVIGIIIVALLVYKLIPKPYLCYGYKPVKIGNQPIEFNWTGDSYQCRFGIANSGIFDVKNPILQIRFIDGANVTFDPNNTEWQKNDDVNYFWSKNVTIHGGIKSVDLAERAQAINVKFNNKGLNKMEYIITSNGIQKRGIINVINSHESDKISQEAAEIAKRTEWPYFKFRLNFDNNQDEMQIYNEGGKFRELNAEVYLFWSITSDKTLLSPKDMVVLNYYNLSSVDSLLSGDKPATISAADPEKATILIDGFKKMAGKKGFLAFISAKRYVHLRYKDIYDESHDDLYDLGFIGGRKMSKNEAAELIKKYNQKTTLGMVIDISIASPEILYEKWKNMQ